MFVVPAGTVVVLAFALSAASTCVAVADGFACRYSAMVPATCGVAIDVPRMVFVAVVLPIHADVIRPGVTVQEVTSFIAKAPPRPATFSALVDLALEL